MKRPAQIPLPPLRTALAEVEAVASAPDGASVLVGMLEERNPLYAGLGAAQAEHVRAHVFAALATIGAPPEAATFIAEELESGTFAPATTAAAVALQSLPHRPADSEALLLKAALRLRLSDAPLDCLPQGAASGSTALQILFRVFGEVGTAAAADGLAALLADDSVTLSAAAQADCRQALARVRARVAATPDCCSRRAPVVAAELSSAAPTDSVFELRLEDQDGRRLALGDFFSIGPSILGFFYTRCMNPERCSLTISKLARMQEQLDRLRPTVRPRIGCVTYDPEFDRPPLLRDYGRDRGFRFDESNRFFRTCGPIDPLRDWLELGVGYGPTTVNRHRVELFVLSNGRVSLSLTRRLWSEEDLLAAAVAAASS